VERLESPGHDGPTDELQGTARPRRIADGRTTSGDGVGSADMSDSVGERSGESDAGDNNNGDGDGDGEPRRRRRRGRRGGRRRGRGGREGDGAAGEGVDRDAGGAAQDPAAEALPPSTRDLDDEPLPTGYGARPRSNGSGRPSGGAGGGDAPAGGERRSGESTGRRRRRRGEGRSRDSRRSAAEVGRSESGGGRRGGRGRRGEERRGAASFARGRRDEFAPVAGGRDEDDEGLEFLGLEDAGHDGPTRLERSNAENDEILAESGLSSVLDVPSWVEAIGIVIAGNLDARARSPRGGDGGRGDASGRGNAGDRGRDGRRGGRPGDQH
jgi:hypothetical protein